MGVSPERKWALEKFIAKLLASNVSKVTRGPARPDRSYANRDRHATAILESANLLLDSDQTPQGQKGENGVRALVPPEDLRRRGMNERGVMKDHGLNRCLVESSNQTYGASLSQSTVD